MTNNLENLTRNEMLEEWGEQVNVIFKNNHLNYRMRKTDFNCIYLTYLTNAESACCVPTTVLSA